MSAPRLPTCRPAQCEKLAVRIEGELGLARQVAALVIAEEGLVPLAGPLDRAADAARRPGHQHEFRIDGAAAAEIAADVAHDHAHAASGMSRVCGDIVSSSAPRRRCRHRPCSAASPRHSSRPPRAAPSARRSRAGSRFRAAPRARRARTPPRSPRRRRPRRRSARWRAPPPTGAARPELGRRHRLRHRRQRLVVDRDPLGAVLGGGDACRR